MPFTHNLKCSFVFKLLVSQHKIGLFFSKGGKSVISSLLSVFEFLTIKLVRILIGGIRRQRWHAWNGTWCLRAVWLVWEKVRFEKGLVRRSSWEGAARPLASREEPQNPCYVHIFDRLAARCISTSGSAERHARFGLLDSLLRGQMRGQTWRRSAAELTTALLRAEIALDTQWQISVSLLLTWSAPHHSAKSRIANTTQHQRQHPKELCRWRDEATLIADRN